MCKHCQIRKPNEQTRSHWYRVKLWLKSVHMKLSCKQNWHLSMIYSAAYERLLFHGFIKVNAFFGDKHTHTRTRDSKKLCVCDTNEQEMCQFSFVVSRAAQFFFLSSIVFITLAFIPFIRFELLLSSLYFHMDPFNIIILLTGINRLHISTLDIFRWNQWLLLLMPPSPSPLLPWLSLFLRPINASNVNIVSPIKIVDKEKCWMEIICHVRMYRRLSSLFEVLWHLYYTLKRTEQWKNAHG